jgi:acetyl-CoA/propionyl-CoA carboxylase biotin carboxyl carrier protein
VVEEAPSPLLDEVTRKRIGEAACATARSVDYVGAGTVEFIVSADAPDEFFFMEMNTRLQVEHPVTELVTGVDLVEWQLRIAAGAELTVRQGDVTMTGHAVEARLYAEDPSRGFLPTGGQILALAEPTGPGVRVDSGMRTGFFVGSDYDPMLAKVIAHGADRAQALARLDAALADTVVLGVTTNIPFLRHLLGNPDVAAGRLDTALLDRIAAEHTPDPVPAAALLAAAAADWLAAAEPAGADPWDSELGWRLGDPAPYRVRIAAGEGHTTVALTGLPAAAVASIRDGEVTTEVAFACRYDAGGVAVERDGLRAVYPLAVVPDGWWVHAEGAAYHLRHLWHERLREDDEGAHTADITSPMPGSVLALLVDEGATVARGDAVVVVEAMKMEHTLTAGADGVVELLVRVGETVALDQPLARVTPAEGD